MINPNEIQGLAPMMYNITNGEIMKRIKKYKRYHPRKTKLSYGDLWCRAVNSIASNR